VLDAVLPKPRASSLIPLVLMVASLAMSAASCGKVGSDPEISETISRELFIQTYIELRRAAFRSPRARISIEARDRILADFGVTEDDLLEFVDFWGTDTEIMLRVWEEVDSIMTEERLRGPDWEPDLEEGPPGDEGPPGRGAGKP
jgi:hypothetical protein